MNELESILNYLETTSLEPHDDYTSEFTYKEQKLLWNYIKRLKEQLELSERARKEALSIIKSKQGVIALSTLGYDIIKLINILEKEG